MRESTNSRAFVFDWAMTICALFDLESPSDVLDRAAYLLLMGNQNGIDIGDSGLGSWGWGSIPRITEDVREVRKLAASRGISTGFEELPFGCEGYARHGDTEARAHAFNGATSELAALLILIRKIY